MKSVLASGKPKYCELIASGRKTVELRKTRPKIDVPFKCYIYCTKDFKTNKAYSYKTWARRGKVMGEFVCDTIIIDRTFGHDDLLNAMACLDVADIAAYCTNDPMYGWHISDLVIYDKPRELGGFCVIDCDAIKKCPHRERAYINPDYTNGSWLKGSYICNKNAETEWCGSCITKALTRPPQSWCYVEEV